MSRLSLVVPFKKSRKNLKIRHTTKSDAYSQICVFIMLKLEWQKLDNFELSLALVPWQAAAGQSELTPRPRHTQTQE